MRPHAVAEILRPLRAAHRPRAPADHARDFARDTARADACGPQHLRARARVAHAARIRRPRIRGRPAQAVLRAVGVSPHHRRSRERGDPADRSRVVPAVFQESRGRRAPAAHQSRDAGADAAARCSLLSARSYSGANDSTMPSTSCSLPIPSDSASCTWRS
jgi:hypothetical protein